ncbi:thioredoxin family protein [Candidatus Uabimicrobium amorphum]|uniref:Thioredoxin-like fold domain-containing protein n=1 Tax=Uabimicrobium amorphum TaxID=2596890 RepID=A0A5S9IJ87_UABAM|nr:thioredoxin family protein [Candidatus Uabimicrobium amorphum]BBM82724.1 hypothetical protein UABAM_01067 [Candidatus Uabimicrobium amorphum]
MKYALLWLCLCSVFADWGNNLQIALKEAAQQKKYVLLYFSDESNCKLCSDFHRNVATKKSFMRFEETCVLCRIDPRLAKTAKEREQYSKLFNMFKVDEVPTVMCMTAKGKVFFRDVYNGESLKDYRNLLDKILQLQVEYQELSQSAFSGEKISTAEKKFMCEELARLLGECPQKAWTLRAKFAYLLFYVDTENITEKRPLAAYTVSLYTTIDKQPFISYLQKSDAHYFAKLMDQFLADHAQKLKKYFELVHHQQQKKYQKQLQSYAAQVMKMWKEYAFTTQDAEINFRILSLQALCYKSLNDKQNFSTVWKKLQAHSNHENFQFLRKLLQK